MNTIVEHINSAGHTFVEFALPMLIQSSVLILILLLLDLLLRKKVKAVFRYWIWMLVLLKLILPTSLSSPFSLGYLFGEKLTYQDLAQTSLTLEPAVPAPAEISSDVGSIYIQPNPYIPPAEPVVSVTEPVIAETVGPPPVPATPLSWQGVVFLVWLAVVIAMGLLLLQRALFVSGLVAQAKKAGHLMNDALSYCCASMGIKAKVGLKISVNATTPSVCGLIRPVILVPWKLTSTLGASRLRTVLMHELAHIRRGDLWVNLIQTALQIIYFYNPLLWLANFVIRRIREQAVDEAVLVAMGEKAQKYPQTLVDVAKMAFKRPALGLRLIGVVESRSALAGRIKHILGRPMPKSARLGLISILAVIIAGAVLLPMARASRSVVITVAADGSAEYSSIQKAIDAASAGSVVRIAPGVYNEQIKIDKPLTLEGAGWDKTTITAENNTADMFEEVLDKMKEEFARVAMKKMQDAKTEEERKAVEAEFETEFEAKLKGKFDIQAVLVSDTEGVVIRGLKISFSGRHIEGRLVSVPIVRFSNAQARMSGCVLTGCPGDGVHVMDGSDLEIRNCLVGGLWSTGIVVGGESGAPSRMRILDSDVRNCYYVGIWIRTGNKPAEIKRCRVSGAAWHGITYSGNSPTIEDNVVFGNARIGIGASHKAAGTVRRNIIYGNEIGGMSCSYGSRPVVKGNTFANNKESGLRIFNTAKPIVRKNIFVGNPTAVFCGDFGGDEPSIWFDGGVTLENNLFWDYERKAVWQHNATEEQELKVEDISLGKETGNIEVDPLFADLQGKDLSLRANSPALTSGIGVAEPLAFYSPWPLQDEELAIIPDGDSRDSRLWKHQAESTPMAKIEKAADVQAGPLDHFVGKYAMAKHPDTAAFEITKEGYVFIFRDLGGPKFEMDIVLRGLEGRKFEMEKGRDSMTFGSNPRERYRVRYNAAEDRYILDSLGMRGEVQDSMISPLTDLVKVSPEKLEDTFSVTLPHGGKLRLLALGRPTDTADRCWEPDGTAIVGKPDWLADWERFRRNWSSSYLVAIIKAVHPGASPPSAAIGPSGEVWKIPLIVAKGIERPNGDKPSLVLGFGVGEWKTVGRLKVGESLKVGDFECEIEKVEAMIRKVPRIPNSSGTTLVQAWFTELPDLEVALVAVGKSGKETTVGVTWGVREDIPVAGDKWQLKQPTLFDIDDLDHFVVRQRPRYWSTFTEFAIEPKKELTKDSRFSATLPNGVTVELMGICELPDQGKQWWAADGSLLEDIFWEGSTANRESLVDARQVVFRISSNESDPFPTVNFRPKRRLQPPGSWSGAFLVEKDNRTLEDFRGCSFSLHDDQKSIDISADVGYGPWKTLTKLAINSEISLPKPVFTDIGYITWNDPIEEDGKTTVSATLFDAVKVWRIVAMDKQGDIHTSGTALGHGFDGHQIAKATFSLPLSRIEKFRFQTRPFSEITFKNVSLEPNFKTDVQVEVEEAATVSAESEFGPVPIVHAVQNKAMLPNGVTVELVGLCKEPVDGAKWWKPDGSDMPEPFFRADKRTPPLKGMTTRYTFLAKAQGGEDISIKMKIYEGFGWSTRVAEDGTALCYVKHPNDTRPYHEDAFSHGPIEVGVAQGQWIKGRGVSSSNMQTPRSYSIGSHDEIVIQPPRPEKNSPETSTIFWFTSSSHDYEYRLVCTLKDGSVEECMKPFFQSTNKIETGGLKNSTLDTKSFVIDRPLEQIVNYELLYRKFDYARFNNVAFKPNAKTDVRQGIKETILPEKLVMLLIVINSCAPETDLNIESVSIKENVIKIGGGTSDRTNTRKFLDAIKDNGLNVSSMRLNVANNRDKFSLVVEPKQDWQKSWQQRKTDVQLGFEENISPKLVMLLVAMKNVAAEMDLNIESISVSAKSMSIEGDTSGRTDTLKFLDAIKDNGLSVSSMRLNAADDRDKFSITAEPKENWRQGWQKQKSAVPVEVERTGEENQVVWGKPIQGVQVGVNVEKEKWCIGGDVPRLNVEVRVSDPKKFQESALASKEMAHDWSAFAVEIDGKQYKQQHVFYTTRPVPLRSPFKIVLSLDDEWQGGLYGEEWLTPGRHKIRVLFVGLGMRLPSEPVEIEILPEDKKLESWPYPWGEAVRGVQVSAHPAQPSWPIGSEPVIRICMRNQGKEKWSIHERPSSFAIEVDGKRYENNFIFHVWRRPFEPGDVHQFDLKLSKSKPFHDGLRKGNVWPPVGKPPPLLVGKHTVRVLFTELGIEPEPASRPIEFEIVPATSDVRVEAEKPVVGEWKDVGNPIPADFNDTIALIEQITLGSIGQDAEGKTFITFIWDKEKDRNWQYRFVLIKSDDTILEPDSHLILDENGRLKEKFTFDEPYVSWRLKEFKFQNRPLPLAGNRTISSKLQKGTSTAFEGKIISPSRLAPPGRYAIELDGVDDYLLVPDSPTLRLEPPFTVEMWIKPRLPEQNPDRMQQWGVIAQGGYIGTGRAKPRGFGIELTRFEKEPATFQICYTEANDNGLFGKDYGNYRFDEWMHISHVFEGENYKPSHGHPLVIGRFLIPFPEPFMGQIGEVRIWNGARTREEIRRYKNRALTGKEPGLAACWTFEQAEGQFAYDISGNNNHARLGRAVEADGADPKWVDLEAAVREPGRIADVPVEVEGTAETEIGRLREVGKRRTIPERRKGRIEFLGLDLTDAPHTTKSADLPDLFEERPLGSKSYEIASGVTVMYGGFDGMVYYIPEKEVFYIQQDKLGSSTRTYYGPFDGDPKQVLDRQIDVPIKAEEAEASSEESVPASNEDGPRITFESLVCDLGRIPQYTKHVFEFKFTNTGNEVLKITRVRTPCACTVPKLTEKEYAPGESGTLKITYHSGASAGQIKKYVYVHSNDKVNPRVKLTIKAEIVIKVAHEPKRLNLVLDKEDAGCPAVTLTSLDDQPFSITGFESTGDSITADFDSSLKRTSFVIRPKVDMEKLRKGMRGQINVSLDHPECKRITVSFETLTKFKTEPRVVYVREAEPQKPITKKVRILSNYNEDFEIESTSSKNGNIKVLAQEKVRDGYQFELEITPPEQESKRRVFTDVFTVELKGAQKLQITCYGIYSRKPAETTGESPPKSDVHLEVAQSGGDSVYGNGDIVVVSEGKSKVYGSIQEAIEAAPAGSVVRIGPGVYKERLEIDKPLTLEGAGWDKTTIVTENNTADAFEEAISTFRKRVLETKSEEHAKKLSVELQAQFEAEMKENMAAQTHIVSDTGNVVIRNLKLTSPGRNIEGRALSVPIIKFSNAGALMSGCAVVGTPGDGIHVVEGSDVEIRDSLVAGVWSTGIAVAAGRGNIAKARIINCDVRNCYHRGITIGPGCDSTVVEGCRISGSSWHGIRYDDASPTIVGNLIFANVRCGIYASGRTAADVSQNLFYGNEMSGISCWFKNQDKIEENTIVGNKRSGLEVLGASKPIVRKNIFYANPTAVFCGDIGDDSASAASDGTVNLEENLFWGFEYKVAWRHAGDAKDEFVTDEVELDEKTRNAVFDPEFKDITAEDFSLKLDSSARRSGIGAAVLIDSKSPWPIQDEEIPIIPEGETEDTSWMGRISSTGKIIRPVVPVANQVGKKPLESVKDKPRKQEGSDHPGRISGTVVNSVTGEPVAGAYVGVGDFGDSGGSNYSRHRSEGFYDKTKTDAEGRFELGGLVFTDKHRELEYHPLVVTHPDFVRHDEKIELLSSGPVPDVKVSLRPAATINLTIVDADGNPLQGQWLLRLEALDGRRFIPPGSDPHLSSFASNIWAHWPDLRTQMGVSNGFTFTELDTGEYSIEALKFQLVDKPTPGNIWKPTITYHGSIPSIRIQAGQSKQVKLAPQDYQTRLTITPPEFPDKLMDKLERSSQMPLMCLISRSPGALLWDDGRIRHIEDQRLGRIDKKRFFRGFFVQGKPLTINNLPPDSYSLFTMAVYGQVAGYLIGARADLEKGDKITVDIPWRQPTGPSMFGPNRSFDYTVNLEAGDYSVSQLCGILTEITQSNPRIIADPSIENEKLSFGKDEMSVWDVLEKLYLDKGWRVDEGQDKTLIIKPASQTDVQSNSRQDDSNSLLIVSAVDNKGALTSGATVELLGLTYIPVTENLWWRTDGSPLPKAPFDDVSFTPSVDPNWQQFAYYTVAIQIKGRLAREIGLLKWEFTDAVYAGTTSAYANEKRVYYDNIHSGAVKFPKAVKRTKLRLGIVSGDWQTLVKGSHYGVYREGEDSIIVRTPERAGGPLGVHPGEKGLHIGVTYNVTDRDFRVIAVDKDGKVHLSSRGGSGGTDNLRRTTASFPELTHDWLQEFRFQVRPYEWVEFRDVSLRPSEKAFALAGQRRVAKQKELEKWLGQGKERQIREQILILRESRLDHINEPCVEQTEAISAMRELVRIGEPAVQELTTELRQAEHWLEKSLIAFVLRATGKERSVPALIEVLAQSKYRGEYGIYVKDDELAEFMLDHQHREPDESDRKVHSIIIACPVIEITKALEKITEHSEGPDHFSLEAAEVTKGRWKKWWEQNKTDVPIEESLGEARVVHFPADRSLGKLCVQRETFGVPVHWWWGFNSQRPYLRSQWQYLAEATGDVTVPAGKRLGLIVGRDGIKTLSHLAKLRPDDLYMLEIKCKNAADKPGDDCMSLLGRLNGLKEMILEYPGITNEGLRPIRGLSSLERLSLISRQLDDTGMAHIAELKSLKGLRFYSMNVTSAGLSHLSKLTLLEELFPSGGIDDEGLVHLTKLPALRYLLLTTGDFTENGLAHLKGIPSLRELKVGGIEFSSEGLAHISRIPGLEDLAINNTVLSDEDLVPLKSMNSLKRLSLSPAIQQMARDFTDEALFHLSQVKSLESLVLNYGNFTDKGLEYLAELDNLKCLGIPNNSGFTDAGLSYLIKLPLLEELKLRANQFTDVGMSSIARLTNLKRLDLWGHRADITNKGLARLADMSKLSSLVIKGNFDDEGLAHVGNLNQLSYLDISGDFTDEGLHHLEGLKLLKQLKISSPSKLSPQALQDLRSKLPNLLVLS